MISLYFDEIVFSNIFSSENMQIFVGGMNFGVFDGCLIFEELARGCSGIGATMGVTNVAVS